MLGPLDAQETAALKQIPALEKQLADARIQINRTHAIESGDANAASARACFEVLKATIPEGSSLAWLPQRLSDLFKRQGVAKATFRFSPETPEPSVPGYKNSFWTIDIPEIDFVPLGTVIAALENQEGMLQIANIQIGTQSALNEQQQHVQLFISTVVKQ